MSLVGKALGAAGSAEEAATIIAEAAESGIAASADKLKYVSDQALKKTIKDGARQGTIAITSASGESGAEAREAEKNVYYKLTHDDFGNEKRMSEGELEYAKMMSQQAGDAAFAMLHSLKFMPYLLSTIGLLHRIFLFLHSEWSNT
jgi:hypothetical protein